MCRSVIAVVFLLGVLNATWGQDLSTSGSTDETLASEWITEFDGNLATMMTRTVQAIWNYYTNITVETATLVGEAMLRYKQLEKRGCANASRFDWKNFTQLKLKRWFARASYECSYLSDDEITKLEILKNNMTTIFSTSKICKSDGTCYLQAPALENLTAKSRDWDELLWAWGAWRNVSGRQMRTQYTEMVPLLNKDARLRGYSDWGKVLQSQYEMGNFVGACEELWQQVKPLYQHLHAYVRRKLKSSYPDNQQNFPSTRQIPAHILGNMWGEQWNHIHDLVKPYPNSADIDITQLLKDKGYTVVGMVREADSFFTSLGLTTLPMEFWNQSLFEKPKDGRQVVCHSSAWDFGNKRDFRLLMCSEVDGEYFDVIHHEMGHVQYFIHYKNQPLLFHTAANPGFHEAAGDLMTLSSMTPGHLRKIKLLNDTTDDSESNTNFLMKQALLKLPWIPYSYMLAKWRWEVFNGTTTSENYNKKYWKLRCGLQGISPPVTRTENDFDPGAKFHIGGNHPYINYFMSFIIQYQFHKSLCQTAGHTGPLHKCDIYNSTAAGDKLRRALSLGSSEPWPDVMEIMTGQRKIDAGPLLEYFQPLKTWLENENKDQDVTWSDDCPSGVVL